MTKLQHKKTSPHNPFEDSQRIRRLLAKIDRINGFNGVRVVYFDGKELVELRPHPPLCRDNKPTLVIRALSGGEKEVVTHSVLSKQDDSAFYTELVSSGLSCGAAVLSWIVVLGSAAAIPVSGGTSTAITVLSHGAAYASSLQCGNSVYRLVNETNIGDSSTNAWLDSQDWYVRTTTALDVISVAGGVASVGATLRAVLTLRKAGTSTKEVLAGLNRQQRKRLTEEIIRANNPGINNKVLEALVAAGKYPKRYSNFEISTSVSLQLKDAIATTLSFGGSAISGVVRDPGKIKHFVVGVYTEIEAY